MNHTPGPWTYYHETTGDCYVIRSDKHGAIAETFYSRDIDKKHARLIAAAPTLKAENEELKAEVEALRDALQWAEEDHSLLSIVNELEAQNAELLEASVYALQVMDDAWGDCGCTPSSPDMEGMICPNCALREAIRKAREK